MKHTNGKSANTESTIKILKANECPVWIVGGLQIGGGIDSCTTKEKANPMEGRMSCVCLAHCGLRCLRPEQLFQGQLHVQQRCMAVALQLRRGLLSVLYLIPQ